MPTIRGRRCSLCNREYDVLWWPDGTAAAFGHDDGKLDERCPYCLSDKYESLVATANPAGVKGYPYFDRGLGCEVESPAHRRRLCKEKGLVPVDGDFDEDASIRKMNVEEDKHLRVYDEYKDRLDNSPEFADYREARSKGLFKFGG